MGAEPSQHVLKLKLGPGIRNIPYWFTPALGAASVIRILQPLRAGPPLPRLHLCPGVLAPVGLCCPILLHLMTPSASLTASVPLPGLAGYRDGLWHSRTILPGLSDLPGFHYWTLQNCRLQSAGRPNTCSPVLPCRLWSSSRLGNLLTSPPYSRKSAPRGRQFSATVPFSFDTALLVARPLG